MSEYLSEQVSDASEVHFEPSEVTTEIGEWLPKQEAASRLGVSEKTIENRVRSGEYKSEKRQGRAFIFIPNLSEVATEPQPFTPKLFGTIPKALERTETMSESFLEYVRNESEAKSEEIRTLKKELRRVESELSEALIKIARLEGEMSGKDSVIAEKDNTLQAKDQAINAANAAVMLMEQQKQTLDIQAPKQLETALKKPWWRFGI